MKAAILTIGDEVIQGKVVNTNASFLAKLLEGNHIIVSRHLAVRDEFPEIEKALQFLFESADTVITTGGLGPTVDDITKEACARYFNQELVLFPDEVTKIEAFFNQLNVKMTENNLRQACFINGSIIVKNDNGTAPGMIYEHMGNTVINLPGPPKELEPMLYDSILPYLKEKNNITVFSKKYRLMNVGESSAETLIKPLYPKYPDIKIAPYASVGVVDYMITTSDKNQEENFKACCHDFEVLMDKYIIGDWSKSINEIIVELMTEKKLTLAIAESCTGGMVSSMIVDVPGSSNVLLQGVVSYSNASKHDRLEVKTETLEKFGAVSEETAMEMAVGIAKTSGADFGISTTGIAGPTGGTKEKPVGLVYTAIYYKGDTKVFTYHNSGDRYKIRQRTTISLLYELYRIIKAL